MESCGGAKPFDVAAVREEDRFAVYYVMGRIFGWTPDQVDRLGVRYIRWLVNRLASEARENRGVTDWRLTREL